MPRWGWLLGFMVFLAAQNAAAQQTGVEIARRDLLAAAQQARISGDHQRALDLALRAGQVRFTPSHRLFVAEESAAVGHLLAALDQAGRCVTEATADLSMNNRENILGMCRRMVADMTGRIGHVTLRVSPSTPFSLRVTVEGAEVARALWGRPFPVEPGPIVIDGRAGADIFLHRTVRVASGANVDIDLVAGDDDDARSIRSGASGPAAAAGQRDGSAGGFSAATSPSTVRPFPIGSAGVALFEVSVEPIDTDIKIRRAGSDDDPIRVCEGRCVVELPAGRLWEFSASRRFWGYGSQTVRTGGEAGTVRHVSIELRHNAWANVLGGIGLALMVGSLVGALADADCSHVFQFEGHCAGWSVAWDVGIVFVIMNIFHPANRSQVSAARRISLGGGPRGLTVLGTF